MAAAAEMYATDQHLRRSPDRLIFPL